MAASSEATLRIHFTREDLLRTRIAARPDPMWEVVLGLHALQARRGTPQLRDWRRSTVGSVPPAQLWRLLEVSPPLGYFPDFLTPSGDFDSLDDQLEASLSTPRRELSGQIRLLAEPSLFRPGVRRTPWLRGLEQGEPAALAELRTSVLDFQYAALDPYWDRIRAAIGADRQERVEQYAGGGLDALLSGLHPRVRWRPPVLEVLDLHAPALHLQGRGLLLQPSYFCERAPTKLFDPGEQPVLIYPVCRPPEPLAPGSQEDDGPAAALLGRTRAVALAATAAGCTTSELADRCRVAVSTASHQTGVLREAGLIRTRREGGSVVHEITDLGSRVLAGQPVQPFRS